MLKDRAVITVNLKDGRSYGCISIHSCVDMAENREEEEMEFVPALSFVCSGSVEIFPISKIKSIELHTDNLCYFCDQRIQ